MKRFLIPLLLAMFGLAALGATSASAGANDVVRYDRVSGNHPTVIQKVVVNGDNCMNAEDSVTLRLDQYDPADGRAVYHCVQP